MDEKRYEVNGEEKTIGEMNYEEKTSLLEDILTRLDNSETPIDNLAEDIKLGARVITEQSKKLKQVEIDVKDAFKELEDEGDGGG